jgi:ornithine racemase
LTPAPRLEIDLDKIHHNAHTLVQRLARSGISVTGVTKATLGSPAIAAALVRAGVHGLGDSRIENIETLYRAGMAIPLTLIRPPMLSQVDRVIACADTSCNTELDVIAALSASACRADRTHGILLMVELGDLREGIMPDDLEHVVRATLRLPNLTLDGIGCNLACRHGVSPDARNMAALSSIAESIETTFGIALKTVSGGNSANLTWAAGTADPGRINNLRLGEAILLGREPLHRTPIEGLHTDAISLVAEVIESKIKPSQPWGDIAQSAFGDGQTPMDRGPIIQTIVAVGRQDIDPAGLRPPCGNTILGASSDHLIVESSDAVAPGTELAFEPNYSALVRAMTSPFVAKVMRASRLPHNGRDHAKARDPSPGVMRP